MSWQVIERNGEIRIAFVVKGGVIKHERTTRYGTLTAAREAAKAANRVNERPATQ